MRRAPFLDHADWSLVFGDLVTVVFITGVRQKSGSGYTCGRTEARRLAFAKRAG
jgi:hypothetical protein